MADLLQGSPLPNITTTSDVATSAPDWYNQYMQDMANTGTAAMGATPANMVAPLSTLQNEAIQQAPTVLQNYQAVRSWIPTQRDTPMRTGFSTRD